MPQCVFTCRPIIAESRAIPIKKRNIHIIDGCVFTEGSFTGYSEDVPGSGLTGFFLTVPSSEKGFRDDALNIAKVYNFADHGKQKLKVAKEYNDIINPDGNISIILSFQDPKPIENSLDMIRLFYELGVRVIQLTYNKASYLGTGCTESTDSGLTDFGKEAVKEMNRLGILIDLSHCSYRTALDAMELSSVPVVFSHANVKALCNSPRNKTDLEIKLIKQSGGVIGVTPWGPLCWKPDKNEQPGLDDFLDHVDYIVNLAGIDHVGFGGDNTLDYSEDRQGTVVQSMLYPEVVEEYDRRVGTDPSVRHVKGYKRITDINNVVGGLQRRGYNDEEINKFLGENFLRVIKKVWK